MGKEKGIREGGEEKLKREGEEEDGGKGEGGKRERE